MIPFDIRFYDSLGSTQDEARRLAQAGAQHGTVVTAREQTTGRGRQGRSWTSPVGNVYLSILLRPELPPTRVAELGFVAALAVADVVDAFLPSGAMLKWPNDVLVGGAKISGILVEHAEDVAIVGIGVNVLHVPEGAPYPVTSLEPLTRRVDARRPLPQAGEVDAVRGVLLDAFARQFDAWTTNGFAQIRAEWLRRAHPSGTKLHVSSQVGAVEGRFAGIDDGGALLLDTTGGLRRLLAGDVSVRV